VLVALVLVTLVLVALVVTNWLSRSTRSGMSSWKTSCVEVTVDEAEVFDVESTSF